jgi:TAT (twin-arginine translocation) pathway signal sequence
MSRFRQRGFPLHRRDVLKGGASVVGAAALPGGPVTDAIAATSTTLVIRARNATEPRL